MTRSLWGTDLTLRVDQSTKVNKSIDTDSRLLSDRQPITGLRNHHPLGHSNLRPAGQLDNQNCRLAFPQKANHLNFYAIERMEAIADLC
jgi:hypothetical protein